MIHSTVKVPGIEKLNNTTPDKNSDKTSESKVFINAKSPKSMSEYSTPVKDKPQTPPTNEALPAFTNKSNPDTHKPSPERKRKKTEGDKASESKKMKTDEKKHC